MAQSDLAQVLGGLPIYADANVLVGHQKADDAGVYRLSDDLALVQTVDYFTPVVDDPYDFGRVAAANALSDVYAMGASPFMALNIVGFPVGDLPLDTLHQILRGGADVCVEAEVAVVGGHSIDDKEPKYGLAVTGRVHPDKLLTNSGAKAGDHLVLTKPLGIGILTTAIKRGKLSAEEAQAVVGLMTTLNRGAARAVDRVGAHSATDITGYGLLGHLFEMASGSGLEAEVWFDQVPVMSPTVTALADEGVVPGGSKKNLKYIAEHTQFDGELTRSQQLVLADAQTSGGLLIAVAPERTADLLAALRDEGTPAAVQVGELREGCPGLVVRRSRA